MKTSRQQLLEYVQQHRAVTAEELSRALHMTQANVRHHLNILKEQSLIEVIGPRPAEGKGRPARSFGPSEKSLGNNLDLLSSVLLEEVSLVSTPELMETFIRHVADRLLEQISSQTDKNQSELINPNNHPNQENAENAMKNDASTRNIRGAAISLTQRLYRTIHELNRFHYHARWEAHIDSPRLILGYCPYLGVQAGHPELCQVDAFLLAGLLQTDVEQVAKLVKDRRGATTCIFRVHNG